MFNTKNCKPKQIKITKKNYQSMISSGGNPREIGDVDIRGEGY